MSDIDIRIENKTGHITLNRPKALNALTYDMCLAIDRALIDWAGASGVKQVLIDAKGGKAFCAGGDIAELYRTGTEGDYAYGRQFWRDEYRMNARIANHPKPVISFLQGFTMGGGVGVGCHGSTRIVGETSQISMPECGIGLVPDVGGSQLLAQMNGLRPGLGTWVGLTGHRLQSSDAILGFGAVFQPEVTWEALKTQMIADSAVQLVELDAPHAPISEHLDEMARHFNQVTPAAMLDSLEGDSSDLAQAAAKALRRASPLAVACHHEILRRLDFDSTIEDALKLEYRFTWRAMEHGDFLEGIRAQIIDKDRNPKWKHSSLDDVTNDEVQDMLAPLGADELTFDA
ncbi:enoyl-CoA hydratase/isomerase family protein [Heliomarina baculiformis]|uniref:enoyl-CoA hydratase/isomerase family protein n=1 Tax=Heliomarina baculiformis TaxID=2872036 RepID=UPI001EE245F9|nr:enoyl-CoA hydratase/isomerase family protein [Heliomarina baculiformis]